MTEKTRKLRFIDENRTKGLQKDWQGYGKSQALSGKLIRLPHYPVLSSIIHYFQKVCNLL